MEIPELPTILPLPTIQGYTVTSDDDLARTVNVSAGIPLKVRTRSTPVNTLTLQWQFNLSENTLFKGWYKARLSDGLLRFRFRAQGDEGIRCFTGIFAQAPVTNVVSYNTFRVGGIIAYLDDEPGDEELVALLECINADRLQVCLNRYITTNNRLVSALNTIVGDAN